MDIEKNINKNENSNNIASILSDFWKFILIFYESNKNENGFINL